jgi:AcrR family transcriptional regulator
MGVEKRRRLTAEERREKILDAALEVFSERGFAAATTRELAARAGITEAIIYRHFRSKEEVLRGVVERDSFLQHVHQFVSVDADRPLRDQLLDLGRNWRRFVHERRSLVTLLLGEMVRSEEMARLLRETMIHDAVSLVVRALRPQVGETVSAERLTMAVRLFYASLLCHFVLEERLGVEEDPHAQTRLETTVDLLLDALGAPPGSSGQASAVRNP